MKKPIIKKLAMSAIMGAALVGTMAACEHTDDNAGMEKHSCNSCSGKDMKKHSCNSCKS